jgi:valyl-tRNA synthetase
MDKNYDPGAFEERWYQEWEQAGIFAPQGEGTPYAVTIPPPNVTGILHMGHALDHTLQDIPVRFQRMRGRRTLWLPGTDHAGIATQNVVERAVQKEGSNREEMGREQFVERVWEWVKEYGGTITRQIRRMGQSVDWNRERFTMDAGLSRAVTEVFVRLYEKGLVYRGNYIINWCPRCHTALSDEEVTHLERNGHLWYVRYPEVGGGEGVVVATTRPETMLGDTAVAVHPDDERYTGLVGHRLLLPLLDRPIPVVADEAVDPAFGTGAVKVTPAHDPNDFEIARRRGLPSIVALDGNAMITAEGGPYQGRDRFEARKAVVADLERKGLLVKVEDHTHAVGHCYRCSTVIEPRLSEQWFVRMKPLAEQALAALERGEPRIQPARWEKVYRNWLENIRDWCISRQIWWGHRIPVWYCLDSDRAHLTVSASPPAQPCRECGGTRWEQDPDVLDTWFSSWLWPFSTLGWPEQSDDLAAFYPTTLLISGYDILFFWDARMVMAGLEFTGRVPFETLYIHGMIQDELGRPMSKSLGNGIDPIEMIDKFGADAVRYSLCILATEGQDIRLSESKFEMGRNFANKLWNASRFVLMNLEGHAPTTGELELELADRWILSRFQGRVRQTTRLLESLKYSEAARELYTFVWNEFCDWYLELVKERLKNPAGPGAATARAVLAYVLDGILRLLHPFLPFVTSEIRARLLETLGGIAVTLELQSTTRGRGVGRIRGALAGPVAPAPFLAVEGWPVAELKRSDDDAETQMGILQGVVSAIRNIKGEMRVPPGIVGTALIRAEELASQAILQTHAEYIRTLASLEGIEIAPDLTKPPASGAAVVAGMEIYLPLAGLIDLGVEHDRLGREAERLRRTLRGAEAKLANPQFMDKAPAEVVAREREKRDEIRDRLQKVEDLLAQLSE